MESIPLGAKSPYKMIIMIEPVYVDADTETAAAFDAVSARVAAANAKIAISWPSVDVAMGYLKKRMPWRSFDSENLSIMTVSP